MHNSPPHEMGLDLDAVLTTACAPTVRRSSPEILDGPCVQGWQYGTVRSEFAYYVPRTLDRTVPAYRTSIQFLKRTVPTHRTHTIPKKTYRTF